MNRGGTGTRVRVIGPGRAGGALASALGRAGWTVAGMLGRDDPVADAARGVDLLVVATPDAAIAGVAAAVTPSASTVVIHLSGSLGLEVLAPHPRRASVHPLVSLPDTETGAARLAAGAWFAVAGDDGARRVVEALDGHAFPVADDRRALYHAAACVAANHVVALLGQVERLVDAAGVPFDPFVELARGAVDNVGAMGPARALTGTRAGDDATVERHLAALPVDERDLYLAGVAAARRLAR